MEININSLERIVPEHLEEGESTGKETLKIHLERYKFASKNIKPGQVLDIACGVGYGSALLVEKNIDKITQLVGVDLSPEAIDYANTKYKNDKIEFVAKDAYQFNPGYQFDTIVSLETIEHLPKPMEFISHLKTLLKKGGIIIASVPTSPTVDANPHHLNDFTKKSFKRMFIDLGFEEVDSFIQIQKYSFKNVVLKKEKRTANLRKNLMQYYLLNPKALFMRIFSFLKLGFSVEYTTVVFIKKET